MPIDPLDDDQIIGNRVPPARKPRKTRTPKLAITTFGNLSRVRAAREALAEATHGMVRRYEQNIIAAIKNGDHEAASKAMQWLFEHATESDGTRPIAESVDKKAAASEGGPKGPTISFNFPMGGVNFKREALPAAPDVVVEAVDAVVNENVNASVKVEPR